MQNEIIVNFYQTGIVEDDQGNPISNFTDSAIPFDQGMAIYNLVRQTKPQRTLEVGLAYGLSALFVCQAHADNNLGGVHTAIDPEQSTSFKSIGRTNIDRAGLQRHFRLFEACSYQVMPRLVEQNERFDFIFIDGMHLFDYTLVDFFFADLLLQPNGRVMFDDVWLPSVRKVVTYVLRNRHYQLDTQWIWKRRAPTLRLWEFLRRGRARRIKVVQIAKHQLHQPFDQSAAYFGILQGSLKYQVLQKIAEDERNWDHHQEF